MADTARFPNRDEAERAERLAWGGPVDLARVGQLIREYAVARPEIDAIWLFGSQARAAARSGSDLDLALQLSTRPGPDSEIQYRGDRMRELESLLKHPVDVLVLSPELPLPLLWEILSRPLVLFEREPELAASYGTYLRGLCRDQWPRVERRWDRTRNWLEEQSEHATPRSR